MHIHGECWIQYEHQACKGNYDETLKQMEKDFDFRGLDGESFRDNPHAICEAMQKIKRK